MLIKYEGSFLPNNIGTELEKVDMSQYVNPIIRANTIAVNSLSETVGSRVRAIGFYDRVIPILRDPNIPYGYMKLEDNVL